MSATPVASREAALRIALAARALNGLDVRALVGALIEKLDTPLTESKLGTLTVEDLRVILAGDFAEQGCHVGVEPEALKEAIRLLWGQGVVNSDFPAIEAYTDGDMPGSLRVAIAANRGENLDGHFGSCERFLVYQVSPTDIRLVDVRSTVEADGAEDRNAARSALINDCQIVYVQSIGGPAAAKVVRAGVHPVKKPGGGPAREALAELQQRLTCPPPWLAQIMGVPAASLARFEEELETGEAA
ncbi:MAG: dinitrogenase iron-molybdenum cofactor biosynthesis protein [Dechloromonas sp.]|nr:MAG: dinitrogenase iron-molybdenum cofactor biosynthesis protein [Dechloromonas sp.]